MGDSMTAHGQLCTGGVKGPHQVDGGETCGTRFGSKSPLMTSSEVGDKGVEEDGVVVGRQEMKRSLSLWRTSAALAVLRKWMRWLRMEG